MFSFLRLADNLTIVKAVTKKKRKGFHKMTEEQKEEIKLKKIKRDAKKKAVSKEVSEEKARKFGNAKAKAERKVLEIT